MKELEVILTIRNGNTNLSPCSLSIYYTSTCVIFVKPHSNPMRWVLLSLCSIKKQGLIGQLGHLPKAIELKHKVGHIPQSLGSSHRTS